MNHVLLFQVSKPKVVEKQASAESSNLSGMFFQRSKKSTPKREKEKQAAAAQEAKMQGTREEKREEEAASTPHTRTAGMAPAFEMAF